MKIQIQENPDVRETEVLITCREVDGQVTRMLSVLHVYDKKITGLKEQQTYILDADHIMYIDTVDKRTFLYTKKEVYETMLRLYELEEKLSGSSFFRATKSSIVNFNQIRSLRPDLGGRMILTMNNGEKLYVSRQYCPVLREKLGIL